MLRFAWAVPALVLAAAGLQAQYRAPRHDAPAPAIGRDETEYTYYAAQGFQFERDRGPAWVLAEHRRLEHALAGVTPQRKGVVDAYVLAVGLDSDPVFGREAREAGKVLSRRYDAAGRTIVLAGSDGTAESDLPRGSPDNIAAALARIAETMDKNEDVLVLYTTSHGAPYGIAYNDGNEGTGTISPGRLWAMLDALGLKRRIVMISACFSGVFVPMIGSDDSVLLTAASSERPSFGCFSDGDWTFFGDALINTALRKSQPLEAAAREAKGLIAGWEAKGKLDPSNPQIVIGSRAAAWLTPLEARMPKAATAPVGRPSISLLDQVVQH
ncbi:C13 family peptidase [Sphingomonas immobilis]|uniref:C13 family peptidase n=1 Tax=Sphingomonas immobilis TaxID=3063997 RepID=A0ABT9A0D8_9SPHN|nr:C13 family peptidase [Sphingomonas sp. CA1-15]MDO7843296.1 C13 family peptidase [Sphingomonas sp. CA1-15]